MLLQKRSQSGAMYAEAYTKKKAQQLTPSLVPATGHFVALTLASVTICHSVANCSRSVHLMHFEKAFLYVFNVLLMLISVQSLFMVS
jgi:hypothetical protein